MTNEELIKKIDDEISKWQYYYTNVNVFLYAILANCWRTQDNDTKSSFHPVDEPIDAKNVISKISDVLNDFYDDTKPGIAYINDIYSYVMAFLGEEGQKYIDELAKQPTKDSQIAILTVDETIEDVAEQLIAHDNIQKEAYISLRTLQWVKDLIEKEAA